ncbi:Clp protease N-terminal domain-containing protein [Kitasatospora camelliae]|uniref:Clp protease N-terminal domain-containing protein n=1 Tax=Kitasatospora camelliae TaxID=3156397 RepID=A0AAU8K2B3_9ACTN
MFERFTAAARRVVTGAQDEARELGHERIGTEHLLLALLREPADPAAAVLVEMGLDHPTARAAVVRLTRGDMDGRALAAIGVDLDAVREAVEAAFGEGAMDRPAPAERPSKLRSPFDARARKVLELSLRETLRLRGKSIAPGHLLLGILREGEGLAARVLADHGLDPDALRRKVEAGLGEA